MGVSFAFLAGKASPRTFSSSSSSSSSFSSTTTSQASIDLQRSSNEWKGKQMAEVSNTQGTLKALYISGSSDGDA
jgi:hypothetical protein